MKTRKYQAFTLVEMLIVMGILSVLMAIGVSVARFAIQRANNIQHQNAVDQFVQAFQSYYTDYRRYPAAGATCADTSGDGIDDNFCGFGESLNFGSGVLDKYVDASFDGGSPARFWYFTSTASYPQEYIVCVSFAEPEISTHASEGRGGYCNGNGFGILGGDAMFVAKSHERDSFNTLITAATGAAGIATVTPSDWDGEGF